MKQVVNGQQVEVNNILDGFNIKQKPSSNVEFYGVGPDGKVFVQFNNAKSYIYLNVPIDVNKAMLEAESIGKFIRTGLKGYEYQIHQTRLVQPITEEKIDG